MDIAFVDPSEPDGTGFEHVLGGGVVDAHGGQYHIGTSFNDLVDSLFEHITLFLPDLLQVLRIVNQNLNAELQPKLIQIKIQTSDLGTFNH